MARPSAAGDKLRGIILLVLSASLYGVVDGLSKILADSQSIGQIVWTRYALALPVLILTTPRAIWPRLFQTRAPRLQIIRGITPLFISSSMVAAVRHLPLAEATVILFAGPFLVVALSAPILGERVSPVSWIAVTTGFVAVLIVAQPGFGTLSAYVLFPLAAAVFFALFQLFTRRLGAAGEEPSTTLAWTLAIGALVSTPIAAFTWQPVEGKTWLVMIALGVVFGMGQTLMIRAFARAPAAVLTPFSYVQIISAVIFGYFVFDAVPGILTFVGIALIIGAGVAVARSQRPRGGP